MIYDPRQHHRRSIRLSNYDYSMPGAYFVTIVTWQRGGLFGNVENDNMHLNPMGMLAAERFGRLPNAKTWIVMPNHVHFIIMLEDSRDGNLHNIALPTIIQNYKSVTSREINDLRRTPGKPVWQRNYYDHIVRSWTELERVTEYILDNPRQWAEDPENIN